MGSRRAKPGPWSGWAPTGGVFWESSRLSLSVKPWSSVFPPVTMTLPYRPWEPRGAHLQGPAPASLPAAPGPRCPDTDSGLTGRMSMSHMPMLVVTTWPTPSMVFPDRPCRER